MFLRATTRKKDGKVHEYWSIVESRRLGDGRVAQRQVLYLGEINASQREAWSRLPGEKLRMAGAASWRRRSRCASTGSPATTFTAGFLSLR